MGFPSINTFRKKPYISANDNGAVMLLSCPAKKVTKERGIGEALRLGAPARRAALPYVAQPARIAGSSGAP